MKTNDKRAEISWLRTSDKLREVMGWNPGEGVGLTEVAVDGVSYLVTSGVGGNRGALAYLKGNVDVFIARALQAGGRPTSDEFLEELTPHSPRALALQMAARHEIRLCDNHADEVFSDEEYKLIRETAVAIGPLL